MTRSARVPARYARQPALGLVPSLACPPVAQNPDPALALTSLKGVTRTLDDWATVFNLAIVLLPARPEAGAWVKVIDRLYKTFGDSDVRTTICVSSTPA